MSKTSVHGTSHACSHENSFKSKGLGKLNPVTGEEIDFFEQVRMCGTMREFGTLCGPEAKLFEEKV